MSLRRLLPLLFCLLPAAPLSAGEAVKVLLLGDSLTEGHGVAGGATYAANMESALRAMGRDGVVLRNAGIGGSTSASGLSRLRWHLREKPPPSVLVLALREISGARGFALSFTLTLTAGLVGLFTIELLKASFTASLAGRSRAALGADLLVRSRRQLSEAELSSIARLLPAGSGERRETSLLSMALAPGGARLVELRAVDGAFPFYSSAGLRRGGRVGGADRKEITEGNSAWVAPELASRLGAEPGTALKLGDVTYAVTDVVTDDPATAAVNFSLAPRVYVGLQTLTATGLLQTGSRVSFRYLYRLPPGSDPAALARAVSSGLKASGIRAVSHQDALEDLTRGVLYVGDYLGLVALSGLFLSAVGCVYLARSFLASRLPAAAILLSLGASHATAFLAYLSQFLLLSLAAAAAAGCAALLLVRSAAAWAGPLIGGELPVSVTPRDAASALAAEFPNVSVVDVEATVRRGLELTRQISTALSAMAWTALFAGLAVLFAIARQQAGRLVAGMALMKVLGASPSDIAAMAALEFAALGLAASAAGAGLSCAGAAVLSRLVFDSEWLFSPGVPLLIVLATTALCCAMGLLAGRRALAARPASLLNAD